MFSCSRFHNYFHYIVVAFFYHIYSSKTNYSENELTRKHAIEKRRVGPGNIGHLSKTFPLEPMCNIFKILMSQNIVNIRQMHLKRQSFDNFYIQEPVYWLVLM